MSNAPLGRYTSPVLILPPGSKCVAPLHPISKAPHDSISLPNCCSWILRAFCEQTSIYWDISSSSKSYSVKASWIPHLKPARVRLVIVNHTTFVHEYNDGVLGNNTYLMESRVDVPFILESFITLFFSGSEVKWTSEENPSIWVSKIKAIMFLMECKGHGLQKSTCAGRVPCLLSPHNTQNSRICDTQCLLPLKFCRRIVSTQGYIRTPPGKQFCDSFAASCLIAIVIKNWWYLNKNGEFTFPNLVLAYFKMSLPWIVAHSFIKKEGQNGFWNCHPDYIKTMESS